MLHAEHACQPFQNRHENDHVRALFGYLYDQFPFNQFQPVAIPQTGSLNDFALGAGPAFARRIDYGRARRDREFNGRCEFDGHVVLLRCYREKSASTGL